MEFEFSLRIDVNVETIGGDDNAARERIESLRRQIEEEAKLSASKPRSEAPAPAAEPVAAPPKPSDNRFRKKLNEETGEVVLGKSAFGEYIDINTLDEAYGDISIKGEIFATDCRTFEERGTANFSFDMTDFKGSVRVVVRNIKLENLKEVEDKLKKVPSFMSMEQPSMTHIFRIPSCVRETLLSAKQRSVKIRRARSASNSIFIQICPQWTESPLRTSL